MLSLIVDTSAGTAVALVEVTEHASGTITTALRAQRSNVDPRHHAEQLAVMLHEALTEAEAAMSELECVISGTGPAPFTGLRVGLVSARTIAHTCGVPLLGVPSLDALARTVFDSLEAPVGSSGFAGEVAVVTDARRREVYGARYRVHGADDVRAVVAPFVDRPAAAARVLLGEAAADADGGGDLARWASLLASGQLRVAGPGVALFPDEFPPSEELPAVLDLAAMARIAIARRAATQRGEAGVPTLDTEPLYLRRPDIHGAPQ